MRLKPTVQSLILAVVTILIILVVNIYTTGFIKSISILIGLIAGTAIAASMGLVDFTPVAQAPVVHVPTPFFFGAPKFEITSIVMMCIIATVSMVESTGVYLALSDITKIQLIARAFVMATVLKDWLSFSAVSSIPSHTLDSHKMSAW